eukprot:SAG31_NODE_197_length_20660_cov_8.861368_14_plen_238_part_00
MIALTVPRRDVGSRAGDRVGRQAVAFEAACASAIGRTLTAGARKVGARCRDAANLPSWANTEISWCYGTQGRSNAVTTAIDPESFSLSGSATAGDGGVLQLTQTETGQSGTAFHQLPTRFTTSDSLTISYSMYTGDGTGADAQCVSLGDTDNRAQLDTAGADNRLMGTPTTGLALCFDEVRPLRRQCRRDGLEHARPLGATPSLIAALICCVVPEHRKWRSFWRPRDLFVLLGRADL